MIDRAARLAELRPYVAQARRLEGWTLAHAPQPLGAPPPWDYEQRARTLAEQARTLLDLGTGGGEVLSRILPSFTGRAVATEEWVRNAPVAARLLRPLGANVIRADSYDLPFGPAGFDLVLDRHEALRPAEVARVLAPGGTVLTQQIHPDWYGELRAAFPRLTRFEPHHETYPLGFADAGLEVINFQQHAQPMAYQHLGQIVYHLAAAPWSLPDFDLEADLDALLEVEGTLRRPEGLVLIDRRYILEARKPSA
jgi:SAM-dependent methyltransferase